MDLWNEIEARVSRFEDTEADRRELRALIAQLPAVADEIPAGERERAEELGAEALYQLGEVERLLGWVRRAPGAGAALWLGHALFDLERYREALPHLRRSVTELPLQEWARLKLDELILCVDLELQPGHLASQDFTRLHARHQAMGVEAPVPVELRRSLARARVAGRLPSDVLQHAEALFLP